MTFRIKTWPSAAFGIALIALAIGAGLHYWPALTNENYAVYSTWGMGFALLLLGAAAALSGWYNECTTEYDGAARLQMLFGGMVAMVGLVVLPAPALDPDIMRSELELLAGIAIFVLVVLGLSLTVPSVEFRRVEAAA